ncbi:Bardet-Biedl syndrome 7 protein homolog [Hydra vulgaris]|uniref:Bardet-Biedl syndrome 7 protein homolog n=1 Tax=Hydra vulgaris TaxID=6087 RepID=UPI0006412826|nr:Bardet-Biedl syndrome 7 protein homolog [Hydra vulgaris]
MLALNLNKVNYLQVGCTSSKSMVVIPSSKGQQKIAVGDFDGVITCFGIKKHLPQIQFKTLPSTKINRLILGAKESTGKDKIYIACGTKIKGFTKKGKQFVDFDSNLSEPVQSMFVDGVDLFLCSSYIYNHYHENSDQNYYLASDKINDIVVLTMPDGMPCLPVLACQDRSLCVINKSEKLFDIQVPGSPITLSIGHNLGGNQAKSVVYGTSDGKVGLINIDSKGYEFVWEIQNEKNYGDVLCINTYDVSNNGTQDVIIGRADGVVEIYAFDEGAEPFQHCVCNLSESITSVSGGCVCAANYQEVVVSTYTGWIYGLTTEPQQRQLGMPGSSTKAAVNTELDLKIAELAKEIEQLQQTVVIEREKYQESAKSVTATSTIPAFNINDRFILNHDDASYNLSIEVQMPIDIILLQSNVPVDLLDVEKNSAVVSYSSCAPESGNFLLATYRCQANTTRIELKIRTIEGQYGLLQAYVTPRMQPKTSQVRQYQIKPLSLHQRSHVFDEERPFNVLKLTGNFSLAEVHSWIFYTLPEVPERTPAEDEVTFYFVSTFLDTQLECKYKKGQAVFRSDNVSTISILKDVLTKEATNRKINLQIICDLNEESITNVLCRLHPKLEHQLLLAKQVQLIDGLKELQTNESDTSFMSNEYNEILNNADMLLEEFKKQPCHLERLYGMITDLYIDRHKFKGVNVKNKVAQLIEVLDSYDLDTLIQFFQQS